MRFALSCNRPPTLLQDTALSFNIDMRRPAYVHTYVCMYVHINVRKCTYMYVCTYEHICVDLLHLPDTIYLILILYHHFFVTLSNVFLCRRVAKVISPLFRLSTRLRVFPRSNAVSEHSRAYLCIKKGTSTLFTCLL
jgi:hypothetical protein